jgi:hypothetical protein
MAKLAFYEQTPLSRVGLQSPRTHFIEREIDLHPERFVSSVVTALTAHTGHKLQPGMSLTLCPPQPGYFAAIVKVVPEPEQGRVINIPGQGFGVYAGCTLPVDSKEFAH